MKKFKIAFIWQGISNNIRQDGLAAAMELLESKYDVDYIEPFHNLEGYDVLIYHESPCTINGPSADNYLKVKNHGTKKILLFSGGPVNAKWVEGFDAVCVESQINVAEFNAQGRGVETAFGINDALFRPIKTEKKYKGIHHGTCASWKRQWIGAQAFGDKMLIVGRKQETDSYPFNYSKELGAVIHEEVHGDELVKLICSADVLVQTSDFWGGGQRATLEAMACGVPVICMEDSPKNREYVEESGAGVVASPDPEAIKVAYNAIMLDYDTYSKRGPQYVAGKWRAVHYAMALDNIIKNYARNNI